MNKILLFAFLLFCSVPCFGTDTVVGPRVSVFSTTVDWAGVTGLPLKQYSIKFDGYNRDLVKRGLVLYYLDSFPCYGQADSVHIWVSPNGTVDGELRLVCVHRPESIKFAWHNAKQDAVQTETTGILECSLPARGDLTIDLSECTRGLDWSEYR